MYINDLNTIKLYYPFLKNHINGEFEYLSYHTNNILTYLLFVDQVVLPPSFFLSKKTMGANLIALKNNEKLRLFTISGKIITTSTDQNIRDFNDLQAKYSVNNFNYQYNIDMKIYLRNESIQKNEYSKFILNRLEKDTTIYYGQKLELNNFLKSCPKREDFDSFIHNYKNKFDYKTISLATSLSSKAYYYGGAVGNDAIMPSINRNDTELFYNHFYSLEFIEKIAKKFKSHLHIPTKATNLIL